MVGFLVALGGCPAPGTEPAEPGPERAQLAQTLAPGFQEHLVISGRTQPTAIRFARNGHVFVAEKRGLVFEYDDIVNGPVIAHPVIDIRNEVHDFWDRGLLGLAVHPNYPATPEIYLLYAHDAFADGTGPRWGDQCPDPPGATAHGCVVYGRLSRVVIDLGTMTGTEVPLISNKWCQQYPSHSVGDLHFGPDGYLYVSAGDGASFTFADYGQDGNPCGDPPNPVGAPDDVLATAEGGRLRSQDILSNGDPVGYGGSILRLDVSGQTVRIPPDNPLVGKGTTDDDAVVAIGLRNPFRWTFRPGTRELWIGDVGETTWEEIDRLIDPVASVTNFGWPCYEGPDERPVFRGNVLCDRVYARSFPGFVGAMTVPAPFLSYNHGETFVPGETACGTGTSSITGLAFNDQSLYPADYRNALFVADGSRRCIWTVAAGATGIPDPTRRAPFLELSGGTIVDLEMGLDGRLYYVDFDLGNIYRFDYSQGNQPPVAHLTASPTSGLPPLSVTLDASASTDTEDGANLTYAWDLDGDGVFDDGTRATVIHTFTQPGVITASVQVSDTLGASAVARVDIDVGNTPPTPVIASPSAALTWAVGQAISFAGSAADAQDGPLPDRALSWELIVHHCRSETMTDCHTHSIMTVNGVSSGSFTAPDHEWPSYLELRLTAFDSGSQWYDPAWPYRRALGIDSRAQASALTNIPVLVTLTPARIDYARTQTGGRDLRFTDSHGQVLSHEIESWNPGGTSLVWVRVPVLQPASNDNRIYVYYGNPTATDAQRPTEVWSNGYVGVWHLGASLADSSSSGRAGIDHATSAVTGAVGAGTAFDGISSYIDLGTSTMFGLGGNVTVEAWAKLVTGGAENYPRIVSNKPVWDAGAGVSFELNPGLGACTLLGSGSDFARGQAQIDGQFHYYAASIAGTTGAVYTDGIDVTFDGVVSAAAPSSERLTIGRESAGSWFGGVIDEVRLSNVARSHDWVNAQYRSMIDQMISYGSEEPSTALGSSVSVVLQPRTSLVSMSSDPAGLTLQIGARVATTPLTGRFIVGSRQTVTAPSPQTLDGVSYTFAGWSDGQAATHSYDVPATDSALRTVYRAAGSPACGATRLTTASASASSLENASFPASAAIDGNPTTRWSSAFSDPQFLVVDLGAPRHISRVVLRWEAAASGDFDIDVADTATGPWLTVHTDHAGDGGVDDIAGLSAIGRYVRMYSRQRTLPYGNSLFELEVYGDNDPSCTPPPPDTRCGNTELPIASASASSLENASLAASAAIDGDLTTRWSSAFSDPQLIVVDLGAARHVSRVVLRWEIAASADYDLDVADSASGPWRTVYSDHAGNGGIDDIAGLNEDGRFVRMYSRARTTPFGNSLYELAVFGDPSVTCTP